MCPVWTDDCWFLLIAAAVVIYIAWWLGKE